MTSIPRSQQTQPGADASLSPSQPARLGSGARSGKGSGQSPVFPVCPPKCTHWLRKGQATRRAPGSPLPAASKGLQRPGQLKGGQGDPPQSPARPRLAGPAGGKASGTQGQHTSSSSGGFLLMSRGSGSRLLFPWPRPL